MGACRSDEGFMVAGSMLIETEKVLQTQFCLRLSLLAVLPSGDGGLDDHVIYIDVESKCSSKRFIEIGMNGFSAISYLRAKPKSRVII
ncbi:DNA repair protein RAD51 [Artemisia annua]|uniref:DNA repair protein RAD51 n=1 Tax=Artemisia annua TaxID=35608 RepID=A0A2U1LD30_ARTAN|nr:DNA repair protein RAD51 [Artemisia annua]